MGGMKAALAIKRQIKESDKTSAQRQVETRMVTLYIANNLG